jgi:anti-anti-sigma factor
VIVGVEGRLDSMTSSRLEGELLALIAKAEHRLILDCSRLVYISSAGLRAVLLAAKRLKNAGGVLVLCSLNAAVQKVFDLAGFASSPRRRRSPRCPHPESLTDAMQEKARLPGRRCCSSWRSWRPTCWQPCLPTPSRYGPICSGAPPRPSPSFSLGSPSAS